MFSLPVGIVIMSGVLIYALFGSTAKSLLNWHSIVVVFAGTIAVLLLSTPVREIKNLLSSLLKIWHKDKSNDDINQQVLALAKDRDATVKNAHPLIVYAKQLWEQGIDEVMFRSLLEKRFEELSRSTETSVAVLRNLAKYPPALGMTGTVMGMVALFSSLTVENKKDIGPHLAMAMTATFYGLVLANAILMPLADRLHVMHLSSSKRNELVYRLLIMIHQGEPTSVIEGELIGHAA